MRSMQQPTVALDAMGGDHGPSVIVPAAIQSLRLYRDLRLILVGDEQQLRAHGGEALESFGNRLRLRHASQIIAMDDLPSKALRNKRDSSMRVAIDLVKEGEADACVSAGNTGALMATARFVLKTLPGIDRPAIITAVPALIGHTYVLDLGANVDCTAEHLYQFAVMGNELVRAVDDLERPRVGLLNIGAEEIKGNEQVKQAMVLLSSSPLNFVGYVEGDDLYTGRVDVVVTDGFVGNVALKSSEGVAKMITHVLKQAFHRNLFCAMAGIVAQPVLKTLKQRIDPRLYNGASLLGLRGIVIKSHGNADGVAFGNAIRIAMREIEQAVPARIGERIEAIFSQRTPA